MFFSTNFLKVLHYSEFSNAWLLKRSAIAVFYLTSFFEVVFFRFSFVDVAAVTPLLS